ncbi:MAG: cupin domain-containing protein [Bacteroidales bacterium]
MEDLMNLFDDKYWEDANEYFKGTKRKVLRDDNGSRTILLKLPANFYMAPHSHVVTEQHFVLNGEYTSKGKSYPAGSYQIFSRGDNHGPFESKNGALILVIWDQIKPNKSKYSLTVKDIEKVVSKIKHPEINCSLVELGIIQEIKLITDKVVLLFAFPSSHLPIDNKIIELVSNPIHKLDLDFEFDIRVMTDTEKAKFFKLEKDYLKS